MTNNYVATAVGIANEHVKDIAPVVKAAEVDEYIYGLLSVSPPC